MLVSKEAGLRFIELYTYLLYYAGDARGVLPVEMSFEDFVDEPLSTKVECRDALYEPTPLFDDFLEDNADQLTGEEQEIVRAWNRHVRGTFVVLRHLKEHTIFLDMESPGTAYDVLGLTSELSSMIPKRALPAVVDTVLLPYEGVIVCDGLVVESQSVIDPNMQRDVEASYDEAVKGGRLVTTL